MMDTATNGRSRLESRNVYLQGKRTSIRLEPEVWQAFHLICQEQNRSMHDLCRDIARRQGDVPLTSAVRVFILQHYVEQSTRQQAPAMVLA